MTSKKHPKCKGVEYNCPGETPDFWCDYGSTVDCGDCKYGQHGGRKDPEAKCNQE